MALRRPFYLDAETLLALADYHDLGISPPTDVVERSVRKRSANAQVGFGGVRGGGELGKDVEIQTSYSIAPNEKATVSKVIDMLIAEGYAVPTGSDATLKKDDLVEVEGQLRLTAASLAGKVFFVMRRYLESTDQDLQDLDFSDVGPDLMRLLQKTYVGNELVPIPILVDVDGANLGPRVFVNLRPNLFVDAATSDQIEGDRRVLGTVRSFVGDDEDGYLSTEEWLLPDWEYLMKRLLMVEISDKVQELVDTLKINLPAKDVHAWIKGPAVILDAVAVY